MEIKERYCTQGKELKWRHKGECKGGDEGRDGEDVGRDVEISLDKSDN